VVNAQVRDLVELASGIFQGRVLRELIHDIMDPGPGHCDGCSSTSRLQSSPQTTDFALQSG
jgi:hypothetical protein